MSAHCITMLGALISLVVVLTSTNAKGTAEMARRLPPDFMHPMPPHRPPPIDPIRQWRCGPLFRHARSVSGFDTSNSADYPLAAIAAAMATNPTVKGDVNSPANAQTIDVPDSASGIAPSKGSIVKSGAGAGAGRASISSSSGSFRRPFRPGGSDLCPKRSEYLSGSFSHKRGRCWVVAPTAQNVRYTSCSQSSCRYVTSSSRYQYSCEKGCYVPRKFWAYCPHLSGSSVFQSVSKSLPHCCSCRRYTCQPFWGRGSIGGSSPDQFQTV